MQSADSHRDRIVVADAGPRISKARGHRNARQDQGASDPPVAFLPGYRPQLAEINGQPILGPDPRPKREWRYWDYYGNVRYGWGHPGFYRGRYNGGSFGPCWASTPIGMMPTCGQ